VIKKLSFKSNLGWVSIEEQDKKITQIFFGKKKNIGKSIQLNRIKIKLNKYLSGKFKKNLDFTIFINGTNIQKKIWKQIQNIPYGQTRSYGHIAKIIKTSPRYVGNVCGKNRHLMIIPCHRVVRANGELGGYSGLGGIKLKKRLLQLEH
jgi:methylated-DNA-[protein]-cysteine S-methyltransferase